MPPNKPRKPNTIEEALAGVLSKISPVEASNIIGKSESLIRKASDPDIPYCLSIMDAIALDVEFESLGFGQAPIARMYTRILEERIASKNSEVIKQVNSPLLNLSILMEEIGEVAQETNNALKDSAFSNNEVARISGAIEDAISQLLTLKSSLS